MQNQVSDSGMQKHQRYKSSRCIPSELLSGMQRRQEERESKEISSESQVMIDIYKKYPHIIPGSIEEVPRGKVIKSSKDEELVSHGRICIIKCATDGVVSGCKKTRMINLQDAKQVKQCRV